MVEGSSGAVTLRAVLAEAGALTPGRAVALVNQIAAALDAADREHAVRHDQVDPANIVLSSDGDLTALAEPGTTDAGRSEAPLDDLAYLAPERLTRNAPVSAATDVYALTCVLYECLTGTTPYPAGDDVSALVAAHCDAPIPSAHQQLPSVPAAFDEVVARGLAKDPDERYPSAGALADAARQAWGTPDTGGRPLLPKPTTRADDGDRPARWSWRHTLQPAAARRGLLLTALGGLLIAGVVTALPADGDHPGLAGYLGGGSANGGSADSAFNRAAAGDCLTWPDRNMQKATVVACTEEHRFEVAESVDLRTFPGAEYGPDAAPPSDSRIEQITQEQCEPAVRRYLGPRFDPHSRFVPSMLWSGDSAWRQSGQRRMLCGLQLPSADGEQARFAGKVADLDQSRVWPAGICLGIDDTTNQTTDVPTDCAGPHAMEVTGTVNLAEQFPDGLPAGPDQDAFIKDTCTALTDAYLDPVQLRDTTLTLIYNTISLPSWSAGSHEVACSVGATLGNGGWATLLGSARGELLINGLPPVPPPDIPEERLDLTPIPLQTTAPAPTQQRSNQHLPQQPTAQATQPAQSPANQAPANQAPTQGFPPYAVAPPGQ